MKATPLLRLDPRARFDFRPRRPGVARAASRAAFFFTSSAIAEWE
jgi:hypothetical protein